MHKVIQYIIKREYKFFVLSFLGYVFFLISLRYLNLSKEIIGGFRAMVISKFAVFLLAIIFIERISKYIPKNTYYRNSEYISYIPHKVSTIFNSIILLIILGIMIFHSANYFFLGTTYFELLLAVVTILSLTFLSNLFMYKISLISRKQVLVSITVLILGLLLLIGTVKLGNSMINYFNNYDLTVISLLTLFFALGYYGLCKCVTNNSEVSYDYKITAVIIILISIGIYMSGQYL